MLMVHIFSIFDWLILFLSKIKSELIFSRVAFLYKEKRKPNLVGQLTFQVVRMTGLEPAWFPT